MNKEPHHHLICSVCKKVMDVDDTELGMGSRLTRLGNGFVIERVSVDVIGVCPECQAGAN